MSLHPGPYYVIEGSSVTLPTCHVTGYPAPVVTWRKLSGESMRDFLGLFVFIVV